MSAKVREGLPGLAVGRGFDGLDRHVQRVEGAWRSVAGTYKDYGGNVGDGKVQKLTDNSGYFYLFDPTNVELVAKFVSFCNGSSGSWAIYASGLTDVEVKFKATDTKTGLYKEYPNALGNRFRTFGDGPFTCP